jgi:hypothetical protein
MSLLRASPGMPSPKQSGQSVSSSSSRLTNEVGFEVAEAGTAGYCRWGQQWVAEDRQGPLLRVSVASWKVKRRWG